MNFGTRLRELRLEKNLTQADLANHLALGESTISFYEANKREPDYETLRKLADYFNTTTDYLLCRTNIKNSDNSQDPEIISISRARQKMTPEEYEKWKQVSKAIFPEAFSDEDNK